MYTLLTVVALAVSAADVAPAAPAAPVPPPAINVYESAQASVLEITPDGKLHFHGWNAKERAVRVLLVEIAKRDAVIQQLQAEIAKLQPAPKAAKK